MVTRIISSDYSQMRRLRIQFQLFGIDKKFSGSKNIMVYDDEYIIDLTELHKVVIQTVKNAKLILVK